MTNRRRTAIVAGNWKMNTSLQQASTIVSRLAELQPTESTVKRVLIPPFPWIVSLHSAAREAGFLVGAQNCASQDEGAFTGEVSAGMLAPYCSYIIVGHSERRHLLGESDDVVAVKVHAVLRNGVNPIICVGELLEERESGQAKSVVACQLESALGGVTHEQIAKSVIAYEPVWAIGTGRSATPDDAQEMAAFIRSKVGELFDKATSDRVRIQYGGSVNAANAGSLLSLPDVDGALVGGASLKPDDFSAIINAAL